MAFKIKRFIPESPLNIEGVDPGKKLTKSPYGKQEWFGGSYNSSFTEESDRAIVAGNTGKMSEGDYKRRKTEAQARLSTIKTKKPSKPAPLNPSLPIQGPKQYEEFDTGFGKAGVDFVTGQEAVEEVNKRKTTTLSTKTPPKTRAKATTIKSPESKKIKTVIKAPEASDVDVSKKPTVKAKDNSKKAIRKRKKADKAAGVSKSQMRANKAKSKSEAALEKAKKSKNPDYRSQLKRKSDRLAKRAKRKGNS
jgi:hypothetical protein